MQWNKFLDKLPPQDGADGESVYISKEVLIRIPRAESNYEYSYVVAVVFIGWEEGIKISASSSWCSEKYEDELNDLNKLSSNNCKIEWCEIP
tara:strand:+ start:326 stop:601 length:276 start_codon:yes stop_codon:yes gene_type:complete